jgi:hypothetical protein
MKLTITSDTVQIFFSEDPVERIETLEIVADYDLEGNPVGFESLDLKTPPWGENRRLVTGEIKASFDSDEKAISVWFKKDPRSRDQEVLDAEVGFAKSGILVFVKYVFERGGAARKHKEARLKSGPEF